MLKLIKKEESMANYKRKITFISRFMILVIIFAVSSAAIVYADHFRGDRILVKMDLSSVTELQGFNLGGGGFSCQIYSIKNDFIGDDSKN